LQKQRSELLDWIKKQDVIVNDWTSRPCKLRPEAAKQEIIQMNDLLNAIGDKRSHLMTEMTGSFADDDTSDIEQQLDKLEIELMDAIATKTTGQNVIETYRQAVADINAWFDNLIKKIDVLDIGSGLSCAQKLAAISDIKNEFEIKGPKKLADLKQKAQKVIEVISNLDAQQVEEQLKSVDRRYNDISKRITRKVQVLEATNKGVDCARNEIEQVDHWTKQQISNLQIPQAIGLDSGLADERLQSLKLLTKEAEAKQALAETLERRVANMHNDLEPLEQSQLESDLKEVASKQKELANLLKSEIACVSEASQARKKFETDLDKVKNWLRTKLNDIKKQTGHLPLQSAAIENEIQAAKNNENDIKKFSEGMLNDLQKQGLNILKDCPDADKGHLQSVLDEVTTEYNALKNEGANKTKSLIDLLEGRKALEGDAATLENWLNEAEISTSADIHTTSLPILEEQLAKFENLSKDNKAMNTLLQSIIEQGKAISPTLNNPDKLKLNEQIKNLKDRYNKTTSNINDRIKLIHDYIKKHKEAKAKLTDCVQFLNKIQQEIRDLNKPIGSKVEDVKVLLEAYERILGELNDSKNKMGDIQIENLPELQGILLQQDDLIKLVENQLAHLRQLLLLREQYIALINQIIAFIMKYTTVITDIEKSPDSIEEKIKQYDDVIAKIQECEGLLASASDKGQKIASEGTAADRNAITEQLQSLKQQLQNLRKLVEAQRQKQELTLAEHKKMATDLSDLLDWLHDNEATCKSRPLLDRDPDSVEREINKHNNFASDVHGHLDQIRKIDEQTQQDYGLPGSIVEMISEGRSLVANLPNELKEREKYLLNSKQHRIGYISLVAKFKEWLHEAETRLENGKHGIDYENLAVDLEEFKLFFGNEGPIKDLVTHQIQEAVDKIWPTLSPIEQEDLSQEVHEHKEKLQSTLSAAKKLRTRLEQNLERWKEYEQLLEKVRAILERAQVSDEPVTNLAGLQFNLDKFVHALNDLQSQHSELDLFNQRSQDLVRQADSVSRANIEQQTNQINSDWKNLVNDLENRIDNLKGLSQHWYEFDKRIHLLENQLVRLDERSRNVDSVVRSKRHLEDTKNVIQELLTETIEFKSSYQEITTLSKSVIAYLSGTHRSSAEALQAKLNHVDQQYKTLKATLTEKDNKVDKDLEHLEKIFSDISDLQDRINSLLEEIVELYVFGQDQDQIEKELAELKLNGAEVIVASKQLVQRTHDEYNKLQNLVPADISQELTALELLTERLQTSMDDKDREFKKAKTVRSEYLNGVDYIQTWLHQAELRIQDRSTEPQQFKDILTKIHQELATVQEKLETVKQNGQVIIEKSRNDGEKELVQTTIDQLVQQVEQLKSWLDDKKHQVGNSLDAWSRFMNLYRIVMTWATEKKNFLEVPLNVTTLSEAKQKMNEYSNAVKSIKPIVKNLSEMDKELDTIAQVTSTGDLRSKLIEADEAKVEVEAILLKRNTLLQETCEEWEQCEKKLKEIRTWIDKITSTLESPQFKKKPLRDQLGLCEKYLAEISGQKTKISLSVEKLQVHFRSGIGGDSRITETAYEIIHDLDELNNNVKQKSSELDKSLAQLEDYQLQMQALRQKIIQEEQQLRLVLAPTYLPHDREKAVTEQQMYRERIKILKAKITARNERVKLVIQRGTPDDEPLE